MKIAQSKLGFGLEEYEAMRPCFTEDWLTEGKRAEEFIDKVCKLQGAKYGVLAPNGTLSLSLGLMALGIGPGDKVIVPNHTFIASATSVCMVGAEPIFVDVGEDLQIDVDKCEALMHNSSIRGILPVDIWGSSCNMDKVVSFAKKYNLKVIEDAAQALGVSWNGIGCGTMGDVGSFSFFADKSISTIEGGAVLTNDKKIYDKLCLLRNQGRKNRGTFVHPSIGFNFRMNDLQCAIGLKQLERADFIFSKRKEIFEKYSERLAEIKEIKIIKPIEGSTHVPFRTVIITRDDQQDVSDFMKDKGVEIRTLFYPLHKQPCFQELSFKYDYKDEQFKNSIHAFEHGMCLPNYPSLTDEEIDYICDSLKEYYND